MSKPGTKVSVLLNWMETLVHFMIEILVWVCCIFAIYSIYNLAIKQSAQRAFYEEEKK